MFQFRFCQDNLKRAFHAGLFLYRFLRNAKVEITIECRN